MAKKIGLKAIDGNISETRGKTGQDCIDQKLECASLLVTITAELCRKNMQICIHLPYIFNSQNLAFPQTDVALVQGTIWNLFLIFGFFPN